VLKSSRDDLWQTKQNAERCLLKPLVIHHGYSSLAANKHVFLVMPSSMMLSSHTSSLNCFVLAIFPAGNNTQTPDFVILVPIREPHPNCVSECVTDVMHIHEQNTLEHRRGSGRESPPETPVWAALRASIEMSLQAPRAISLPSTCLWIPEHNLARTLKYSSRCIARR